MRTGSSDSVRKPCAIVAPKGPVAARSGIDVDPLVVARRVGERVDALLVDLHPLRGAQDVALGPRELFEPVIDLHWSTPSRFLIQNRLRSRACRSQCPGGTHVRGLHRRSGPHARRAAQRRARRGPPRRPRGAHADSELVEPRRRRRRRDRRRDPGLPRQHRRAGGRHRAHRRARRRSARVGPRRDDRPPVRVRPAGGAASRRRA